MKKEEVSVGTVEFFFFCFLILSEDLSRRRKKFLLNLSRRLMEPFVETLDFFSISSDDLLNFTRRSGKRLCAVELDYF